jgi:hypothetical protein
MIVIALYSPLERLTIACEHTVVTRPLTAKLMRVRIVAAGLQSRYPRLDVARLLFERRGDWRRIVS